MADTETAVAETTETAPKTMADYAYHGGMGDESEWEAVEPAVSEGTEGTGENAKPDGTSETLAPEKAEAAEPEKKTDPKKPEVAAKTTGGTSETLAPEKPDETKPESATEGSTAEAKAPVDWKAEMKKADKYELLKELGYDDFTIGMLKYKDAKGDFTPYLEAKSVDYDKMTAQQLFTRKMRAENPTLSEKAIAFKVQRELNEKYFLDRELYDEDSDEAKVGQELLDADAEKLRREYKAAQEQFSAPEPEPQPESKGPDIAQIKSMVAQHPASVDFMRVGEITFGEGEEAFHFPVDAASIIEQAAQTFGSMGVDDFTKVNMSDFFRNLAIGQNWKEFEKAFASHYRNLGKLSVQKDLQNATPPSGSTPEPAPPMTPAQKLAREGVVV